MRNYTHANVIKDNLFQQLIYANDCEPFDSAPRRQIANCANHHASKMNTRTR